MPPPVDCASFLDRSDPEEMASLARRSLANPILLAVLECAEGYVMVLNEARQIIAGNAELLAAIEPEGQEAHLGKTPGEALFCVHAAEGPEGCGSSKACALCGVALAIHACQEHGSPVTSECALNLRRNGRLAAVDFLVKASRLVLGCHALTVVVFQDISAQKRQALLEALFLHDLSNTLQSLIAWSERVADGSTDPRRAARRIVDLCQRLRHDVSQQRLLRDAEQAALAVCMEPVELHGLIEELRDLYLGRESQEGPHLAIAPVPPGTQFQTDRDLLLRVLQNMVGNALEATPAEGTVMVRAEWAEQHLRIHVTNPGVVPEAVAARIFHRDVSTKGPGRGLGTYGMKLIGEDYLGGVLSFHSSPADGTRFTLELPLSGRTPPTEE